MGDGFLNIHILARLTGPGRQERMPMVGRRCGNGVDLTAFEQLTNIGVGLDLDAVLSQIGAPFLKHIGVHIAQGHQAHPLDFLKAGDVVIAARVETHDCDADVLVGSDHPRLGRETGNRSGGGATGDNSTGGQRGAGEELATIHGEGGVVSSSAEIVVPEALGVKVTR